MEMEPTTSRDRLCCPRPALRLTLLITDGWMDGWIYMLCSLGGVPVGFCAAAAARDNGGALGIMALFPLLETIMAFVR
jgi:hypothetical protein